MHVWKVPLKWETFAMKAEIRQTKNKQYTLVMLI